MACLIDYLLSMKADAWGAIGTWAQVISLPLSIYIAVRVPKNFERSANLSKLAAYRNIANFGIRQMTSIVTDEKKINDSSYTSRLEECHRLVKAIPLNEVRPAQYSLSLAVIDIATSVFLDELKNEKPEVYKLKLELSHAIGQLKKLDNYLQERHCHLEGYMMICK